MTGGTPRAPWHPLKPLIEDWRDPRRAWDASLEEDRRDSTRALGCLGTCHSGASWMLFWSLLEDWRTPRAPWDATLEPLRGLAGLHTRLGLEGPHARLGMPPWSLWSLVEDWLDPTRALGCHFGAC